MNRNIINWLNQSIKKGIKVKKIQMKQQSNQFDPQLYKYQYSASLYSKTNSNLSNVMSQSFSSKKQEINKKKLVLDNEDSLKKVQSLNEGSKINGLSNLSNKALATLNKIIEWRKQHIAPVDIVGCERLHDQNQPINIQKYQTLIALMLSVQTKDQITGKIMTKLKQYGLKPEIISQISEQKLLQLIRQVNFNKRKTKNIIQVSMKIQKNGLPSSMEQLLSYPGVGVKIATLYMRVAQKVTSGIGVDTHVHRIANRLGWVKNTKNPNETQIKLQKVFPKNQWNNININLVGFGQILCGAKKPKCDECPVNKQCPANKFTNYF